MKTKFLFILGVILVGLSMHAGTNSTVNKTVGGIGGQAIFDTVAKRPIIKSLEINNYLKANTLRPGDLILEIDKIPVHKMNYGEVLKLVQGTVGTPMSLKVLRYNGIEKYYEIKRVRVTLDMNPTWWQVPDYSYYNFVDGINYTISQLKVNGKNSIDTASKFIGNKDAVYCNFNVRGAYESLYKKNQKEELTSQLCHIFR